MALSWRCPFVAALLPILQAQGQAVLKSTCEQVTTFPQECWPRGIDVDRCGGIFVSGGCYLWAVDRRDIGAPRLLASTRRRGFGKVLAREEDLLVPVRLRNKVVAIGKDGAGADTEVNATVVVEPVDDPVGLAMTADGHLLVAENDDKVVSKWSLNGSRVATLAGNGWRSGNNSIGAPYGLAVSSVTGRVCSTDTTGLQGREQLHCYPSDDIDAPTDEVQLLKAGLDNPYHVIFDEDGNLWLSQCEVQGRFWVLLANGTEVIIDFRDSTAGYGPAAMAVDVMDDSRFLLLGRKSDADNPLFLCSNPLSSDRTAPECTSTTSTTSSFTTGSSSTDTSSTLSTTLSSPTLATGTSSNSPTHPATEVTVGSALPSGTTMGMSSSAPAGSLAFDNSPVPEGLGTLPGSTNFGSTSAAAHGSSTADLGRNGATSGGDTPVMSTTTPASLRLQSTAPTETFAALTETSVAPTETSAALAETPVAPASAAPGRNEPTTTLALTVPTETPLAHIVSSAALSGTAPSTTAAATTSALSPPRVQLSTAPTDTPVAPTEMPAAPGGNATSTTTTRALLRTIAPSETSAAPGSDAPAIVVTMVNTSSGTTPATTTAEVGSEPGAAVRAAQGSRPRQYRFVAAAQAAHWLASRGRLLYSAATLAVAVCWLLRCSADAETRGSAFRCVC